ncbi:MAG: hypothetical protein GY938_02775 [Ketobacter sp.]|nr:hypothetical protein [Ketobacter sp.]
MDFKKLILLIHFILVGALTGCDIYIHEPIRLDSVLPEQKKTILAGAGSVLEFTVEGASNSTSRSWVITKYRDTEGGAGAEGTIGDADQDIYDYNNHDYYGLEASNIAMIEESLASGNSYHYSLELAEEDANLYSLITVQFKTEGHCEDGSYACGGIAESATWVIHPNAHNQAPPTWHGSFIVRDKDDIQHLAGYSEITGGLYIRDVEGALDFGNLHALERIGGNFILTSSSLVTNLDGLDSLTEIGGDFYANDNARLNSISGLNSLTTIGDNLALTNLPALRALTGLDRLNTVSGSVKIDELSNINSVSALASLETLGNNLDLTFGNSLTAIAGFGRLTEITGSLYLNGTGINDFSGFQNLSTIGGTLKFANLSVRDLEGFNNIESIGDTLFLESNANLRSVDGLTNLKYFRSIRLLRNERLTNLNGLANADFGGGTISLMWNDSLSDISIFENITHIDEQLYVADQFLLDFEDFRYLESVGEQFVLTGTRLTSLPFDNLISVGTSFAIRQSPLLCQSEIDALRVRLGKSNLSTNGNKNC